MIHNLKIYNTLSGKKEKFLSRKNKKVNLFVCGPTVYDFPHLGHARTYIVFDSFAKYLKMLGFSVFYLQNITDLDDKIIARARERGVLPKNLALAFEKEYLKTVKNLGISSVTKYAKATSHIKEMVNQIERLLTAGYAYNLEDGIYFNISKFKRYGKLSRRTVIGSQDVVSRIDYSKNKKNRGDFCLWKFRQSEDEPSWPSKFGKGRPGWHIEDTAITEKFFGAQYDIHGGGIDLIFPHHEAEIAQMEAISGRHPLAKYWMHTGFLTINGQKMSKSLRNFITVDDFLKRYSVQQLRLLIFKNQWHSPFDYSESLMIETKSALVKIEEFLRKIRNTKSSVKSNKRVNNLLQKARKYFFKELDDNFNTARSIAIIFDFIKETNRILDKDLISKKNYEEIYDFFREINQILGIIDFKNLKNPIIPQNVKKLAKIRDEYRRKLNWQKADEVRRQIEKNGYSIEDTEGGQIIKKHTF